MRMPEGDDWIGVALLVFGALVAVASVWLITIGAAAVGVPLLLLVIPVWLIVADELWGELQR